MYGLRCVIRIPPIYYTLRKNSNLLAITHHMFFKLAHIQLSQINISMYKQLYQNMQRTNSQADGDKIQNRHHYSIHFAYR